MMHRFRPEYNEVKAAGSGMLEFSNIGKIYTNDLLWAREAAIFDVKPSRLLAFLPHVRINGQEAVNNKTCQVKIYNQGAMILPYGSDIRPLTVYSGQNFTGEAVNDFGLESSGGFMNTLCDGKLNNKIRSFKLKRGYMITKHSPRPCSA